MATWATTSDVLLYTGVTVDETSVIRAEADISLFVGTTPVSFDEDFASDSDPYYLKLATCWQAARYGNDEDDTFRFDVTNVSQDGMSLTLTDSGAVLHPKAKWAIRQLSWTKAKTIGTQPTYGGDYFNSVCVSGPVPWRELG